MGLPPSRRLRRASPPSGTGLTAKPEYTSEPSAPRLASSSMSGRRHRPALISPKTLGSSRAMATITSRRDSSNASERHRNDACARRGPETSGKTPLCRSHRCRATCVEHVEAVVMLWIASAGNGTSATTARCAASLDSPGSASPARQPLLMPCVIPGATATQRPWWRWSSRPRPVLHRRDHQRGESGKRLYRESAPVRSTQSPIG